MMHFALFLQEELKANIIDDDVDDSESWLLLLFTAN